MNFVGKPHKNLLAIDIPLKNLPLMLQMCFDGSILGSSQAKIYTDSWHLQGKSKKWREERKSPHQHAQETQRTLQLDQAWGQSLETRVYIKHLECLFQRDPSLHQDTEDMPTKQDWQMLSSAVQVDPT